MSLVCDIAIITILPEEYWAILNGLGTHREPENITNSYAWRIGEVIHELTGTPFRVVTAMVRDPGNTSGAIATGATISRFRPRYVLLVGIAGGFNPARALPERELLRLGDVVVADQIYGYEYGKVAQEFVPREHFGSVDSILLRNASAFADNPTARWNHALRRPQRTAGRRRPHAVIGPVASGEKVVDNPGHEFFERVLAKWPNLRAVEMEGLGAAKAVAADESEKRVRFLMIRGISDMPGHASSVSAPSALAGSDRDRWKDFACKAAAKFALEMVARALPTRPRRIRSATASRRPETRSNFSCGPHSLDTPTLFVGREDVLLGLETFWNSDDGRVSAVIGIGGAGKTAIARQFLDQWLQRPDADHAPAALLVWSFYYSVDTSDLMARAYRCISPLLSAPVRSELEQSGHIGGPQLVSDALRKVNGRVLLVLDGLEVLQEQQGDKALGRGQLLDMNVKQLLRQIVDGMAGRAKVIVTSREPLTDIAEWAGERYREFDVTTLPPDAAKELLIALGVKGEDYALYELAREFDYHALTLNVVGKWLATVHGGAITGIEKLPPLDEMALASSGLARAIKKLARILGAYERDLSLDERALLELLSVFPMPIELGLVDTLMPRDTIRGGAMTLPSPTSHWELVAGQLRDRRLVHLNDEQHPRTVSAHVLVRDYFYRQLSDERKEALNRAAETGLANLIGEEPSPGSDDATQRSYVRQRIHLLLQLGDVEKAWQIYRRHLGGYGGMGWSRGDHAGGARLMRDFVAGFRTGMASPARRKVQVSSSIDYALYVKNLGRLDHAREHLEEAARYADSSELSMIWQNISGIELLRGRLKQSRESAERALAQARQASDARSIREALSRLGTALVFSGDVEHALAVFEEMKSDMDISGGYLQLPGASLARLYLKQRRFPDARRALNWATTALAQEEKRKQSRLGMLRGRLDATVAELACSTGDFGEVRDRLKQLDEWTTHSNDQEMVVAALTVRASLALAQEQWPAAYTAVEHGVRVSAEYGYSLYWSDLEIAKAKTDVAVGAWREAVEGCELAMSGQPATRGLPAIYGARESAYPWAIADALELRAQARRNLGRHDDARADEMEARDLQTALGVQRG